MQGWERGGTGLAKIVREQTETCLSVYSEDRSRVLQDANNERRISEGGYATRQLEELLQNASDAARRGGARVEVLLTEDTLYVANDGEPFDEQGVRSIMASDISTKDDQKIGKFGIGFKSVLAISERPTVLSRTVSFGFDKVWAARTLGDAGFDFPRYPTMRLARTLDPGVESGRDSHLRDFMEWASTVIVLPLSVPCHRLSERLNQFPAEFVLFSPHIAQARLRNLAHGDRNTVAGAKPGPADRTINQEVLPDRTVLLRSGGRTTRWSMTREVHHPSPAAREEGGHVAARRQVEVQYALPIPPSARLGRFWAYFPTHFETTLSGLVNAPWKLSDDRTGLLEGAFNHELLEKVPKLFSDAIQVMSGTAEAVGAIDAMPARGLEPRNWVDREINEPIFRRLRSVPSLPDGNNVLKTPAALKWVGDVPAEWLAQWAAIDNAPVDKWLHPNAYSSPERRKKVARLMLSNRPDDSDAQSATGVDEWLEALVSDGSVAASAAAILLAARIVDDAQAARDPRVAEALGSVRKAEIIRLEDGDLRAPAKGQVFVRVDGDQTSNVDFVDPELAAMPAVRDALQRLGIVVMDRSGELHRLLALARTSAGLKNPAGVWPGIFGVLREIPMETAIRILGEDLGENFEQHVRVRTAAGTWLPVGQVYLAGRIIPADATRDRDRLIDPRFHAHDTDLLAELGAVDAPVWRHKAPREAWFSVYEDEMREVFVKSQSGNASKPEHSKIQVTPGMKGAPPPWPLAPLLSLSLEGVAAATKHLLSRPVPTRWHVRHATNAGYGSGTVSAPETWFLTRNGRLPTKFGIRPVAAVLRASDAVDPAILPAVELSEEWANALAVKSDPEDLPTTEWVALKETADTWRGPDDDARRAAFYSWLPGRMTCDKLVVRVGTQLQSVDVGNIGVTDEPAVYESMLEAQVPALLAVDHDDVERFVEAWKMPRGKDLLQEEILIETSGEWSYLTDIYPPLKLHLDLADQELKLQPAGRIVKMIATPRGQVAHPIHARRDGDTLLVTATSSPHQLAQISSVLGLELGQAGIEKVLGQMEQAATNNLRNEIKRAADDDARLVAAVGSDALRRCVPAQALEILDQDRGGAVPMEVAALARAVHGVGILKQLRPALEDRGLEPPREWAGRRVTRQWVASLGFPPDWAGFPEGTRAAVEMIDGPAVLSPLHDFQEFVTERITGLLRRVGPDRGMVSLPTGAGKTRVTVEALVNAVREQDVSTRVPLVWIAQTDELCEQAAETWTHVWRAIGPQLPMRLGRLWAANEVSEEPGVFQLVIATIDKLNSLTTRSGDEYDWLREASVVVVDEAHASIAPSYTRVLEWLGRSSRVRSEERKPLIGLTATPFRGTSAEQTERLAGRYGKNRLDRGAFRKEDPYEELQDMGVLAQVRHEILDGTDVHLTESDVAEIEQTRRLPSAVVERLGADLTRTLRVVQSIAAQPADWTVLAFAPSVENARVLAALLSHRGIPAMAVSADTESAARRHYIEEFKAGRIRVLTNYNVLTQGFDAPRVQAVYVARPTFSPNVYQQMIGRGLRGPKNGGSEEVLIVNVLDNFEKYGDLLAFNEFEYLWSKR